MPYPSPENYISQVPLHTGFLLNSSNGGQRREIGKQEGRKEPRYFSSLLQLGVGVGYSDGLKPTPMREPFSHHITLCHVPLTALYDGLLLGSLIIPSVWLLKSSISHSTNFLCSIPSLSNPRVVCCPDRALSNMAITDLPWPPHPLHSLSFTWLYFF